MTVCRNPTVALGGEVHVERIDTPPIENRLRTVAEISVLLVARHELWREGVKRIVGATPDMTIVGQARTASEAVQLCVALLPDLILLDMDGQADVEACKEMRRLAPAVDVLVLGDDGDSLYGLEQVLKAGVKGFILKQSTVEELLHAVRVVSGGEVYLTPAMQTLLVRGHLDRKNELEGRLHRLSERETEVLTLVARGLANTDIAKQLNLSIKTVQSHRGSIMGKLDLHNRVDLVKYALRIGLDVR